TTCQTRRERCGLILQFRIRWVLAAITPVSSSAAGPELVGKIEPGQQRERTEIEAGCPSIHLTWVLVKNSLRAVDSRCGRRATGQTGHSVKRDETGMSNGDYVMLRVRCRCRTRTIMIMLSPTARCAEENVQCAMFTFAVGVNMS